VISAAPRFDMQSVFPQSQALSQSRLRGCKRPRSIGRNRIAGRAFEGRSVN
jgi:hypothetical protein